MWCRARFCIWWRDRLWFLPWQPCMWCMKFLFGRNYCGPLCEQEHLEFLEMVQAVREELARSDAGGLNGSRQHAGKGTA